MSFKKMLFVMFIIIIGMFGLMLTTSYAWYSYENGSTTFDGSTGDYVTIDYQNGEYINTNIAVPISTSEIDRYSEKNNFNISVNNLLEGNEVMISVSLTNVTIDAALKDSAFKIDLYYQGSKINGVTGNNITTGTDISLADVILDSELNNLFEIRVYILDDTGIDQNAMMNKSFSAKITIDVVSRMQDIVNTDFSQGNADIYVSSITVDGNSSDYIPDSGYYNMTSSCTKGSTLTWEPLTKTITYENGSYVKDVCSLTFTKSTNYPLLNTMPVGSYVKYVGKNGMVGDTAVACQTGGPVSSSTENVETEAPNSCLGQNAREDIDENGNTYGYCGNKNYKFYATGWRIAYIDTDSKPVIVSAGSPECILRARSVGNSTYIKAANTKSLKYCNSDYVDGDCSCPDDDEDGLCDIASDDVWGINDTDFYYMIKSINGVGKRLTEESSSLGDSGGILGNTLFCHSKYSTEECGYGNELLDNGGYYWFAATNSTTTTDDILWAPSYRAIRSSSSDYAYGLRPIISLSSTVYVIGGNGTINDPYIIGNL